MINNNKIKLKEKNQPKTKSKSNSLITTNKKKLIYEIIKSQKLNEIKTKTNQVTQIMNTIGETFKPSKRNSILFKNNLITQNITNINFRRSLLVQKKLKDIDKLNFAFDKEYINDNIASNQSKKNIYDSSSEDEYDKYMINTNDINLNFNSEQRRIFRILYRKNKRNKNRPFSEYKRNKKLNDLKTNIEYVYGIKLDEENNENKFENDKDELEKNTHYFIHRRKPRFIREKDPNENFTPNMKYDKTKIFFDKKYDIPQFKNNNIKQYINYTFQNNFLKNNSQRKRMIINTNKISKIKRKKIKLIKQENNKIEEKEKQPNIEYDEINGTKFKTLNNNMSIKNTFSKISSKTLSHNNKRNFSKIHIKNLKTENNTTNRKKIYLILKNLLKETYSLNDDLKVGINIISSHLNDYKKRPIKKDSEIGLDLEKIRKDLNLNKINTIIKESDIVLKNEKIMEKKVRKEDVIFLRKIVNIVLQEDRLANKNYVYNNNSLGSKLKKIMERKMKNRNIFEPDEPGEEKKELIKLFKADSPDFFNIRHLSNLIKRYKTMKIK